jgi:D-serine deaminase-like pyridoxal phosphate-dependent protein
MTCLPLPLGPSVNLPVALDAAALDTPAILVDLDIVDANIRHMATLAGRNGFRLRPHVKTHKSIAMARRQIDAGATGVCTATVTEAEVMIAGGIKDVMIAYPLVGRRKFERLAPLFDQASVTLAADSSAVIRSYAEFAAHIDRDVPVLLEVDAGMHRVGIAPENVVTLGKELSRTPRLLLRGVMTHAGHTHDVTAAADIADIARYEAEIMGLVREDLMRAGLDVEVVSAGSCITAPYFRSDDAITEVRPGTYIYNDLRTLGLFACTPDSLAATALATVVSVDGDRVTIDAGSKTLTVSKDAVFGYGLLAEYHAARFTRLSEEHGVLKIAEGPKVNVGQRVRALPVHVCVWMDLQAEVYGIRGSQVVERIRVDAMRHSL